MPERYICFKYKEPSSFQWWPVTGPEATEIQKVPSESKNTFLMWGCLRTGTGCPGRWRNFHPWRYSNPIWTQSCATDSEWLCLSRGVGPDYLHRSLPTPVLLWFYDACRTFEASRKNWVLQMKRDAILCIGGKWKEHGSLISRKAENDSKNACTNIIWKWLPVVYFSL